jgi:hypothetical protein
MDGRKLEKMKKEMRKIMNEMKKDELLRVVML